MADFLKKVGTADNCKTIIICKKKILLHVLIWQGENFLSSDIFSLSPCEKNRERGREILGYHLSLLLFISLSVLLNLVVRNLLAGHGPVAAYFKSSVVESGACQITSDPLIHFKNS